MASDSDITQWVYDFGDALYRWAFFKTNDENVAQDLVQETFLAAVSKRTDFKGESTPKTWLFRILNNKIIDYYRANQRFGRKTVPFEDKQAEKITNGFFDSSQNWSDSTSITTWNEDQHLLDNEEFIKILNFCMDNLPEQWHSAITAKYLSNKSSDDICKELNITSSNYWQIIHRTKLLLKKCIDSNWKP